MTATDILERLANYIPAEDGSHWWCWFAAEAREGRIWPFWQYLSIALDEMDKASPGVANLMIARAAGITGQQDAQYDALLQMCAEVYVAFGAVQTADIQDGKPLFTQEPGSRGGKKPEFIAQAKGKEYFVEVKAPSLTAFRKAHAMVRDQMMARLKNRLGDENTMLPRDNPVKDFLISANAKFEQLGPGREGARILYIVWDDHCQEAVSALLSPASGLLTENSYYQSGGTPVRFPHIDGVVISRYQHALREAMACRPLPDDEGVAFRYHGVKFPPKVLIQNPAGMAVADEIITALDLQMHGSWTAAAEYIPAEYVYWI